MSYKAGSQRFRKVRPGIKRFVGGPLDGTLHPVHQGKQLVYVLGKEIVSYREYWSRAFGTDGRQAHFQANCYRWNPHFRAFEWIDLHDSPLAPALTRYWKQVKEKRERARDLPASQS